MKDKNEIYLLNKKIKDKKEREENENKKTNQQIPNLNKETK